MNTKNLILTELEKGLPAVSPTAGRFLAEAGAVCFEEQNHDNGVEFNVSGSFTATYRVYWPEVTAQMKRYWNDPEYRTEHAAYGIAFLLICDLTNFTVMQRSRKGTGFDYWLGKTKGDIYFENMARLEVSGIRQGTANQVKARVKQKTEQVAVSNHLGLTVYIVVVEFSKPLAEVVNQ